MKITSRDDALRASPTPKSKLRTFERRLYDLHTCSIHELWHFLINEQAELLVSPETGVLLMGIHFFWTGKVEPNHMKYFGDPLGCDFQFRKRARRASCKTIPFLQRYHGRVYLFEKEIVVVIETETDPQDFLSGVIHLSESVEHRIIRLCRK